MVNKFDVFALEKLVNTLLSWSGATEDTPDDTEILSCDDGTTLTLSDLRDVAVFAEDLKKQVK